MTLGINVGFYGKVLLIIKTVMPVDFESWDYTARLARILHNRSVKKWFKSIISDNASTTGRQQLKTGLLIRNDDSALQVQVKMMTFQMYVTKFEGISAISAEPLDWQVKVQKERAQLVIVFRADYRSDKSQYRSLHIPHYSGSKSPEIPSYESGNHWKKIVYKDNSKLWIYAKTANEADRVADKLDRYVDSRYKPGIETIGELKDQGKKHFHLTPMKAEFYPKGKSDRYIAWTKHF